MKVTVLVDNNSEENLLNEWGLSFLIEINQHKILFDTGASPIFCQNAIKMGIDLHVVDAIVISHAHFDHCGGLSYILEINHKAYAYLRDGTKENCYDLYNNKYNYAGIPYGTLDAYDARIRYLESLCCIFPDVYVVPHITIPHTDNLSDHTFLVKENDKYILDTFRHEQSLVIESDGELVVFSSCSHTGLINIICDVRKAIPNKKIKAFVGGLHIYEWNESKVKDLAEKIEELGISKIITGHCTGDGYIYLKKFLGDQVIPFFTGFSCEL